MTSTRDPSSHVVIEREIKTKKILVIEVFSPKEIILLASDPEFKEANKENRVYFIINDLDIEKNIFTDHSFTLIDFTPSVSGNEYYSFF